MKDTHNMSPEHWGETATNLNKQKLMEFDKKSAD